MVARCVQQRLAQLAALLLAPLVTAQQLAGGGSGSSSSSWIGDLESGSGSWADGPTDKDALLEFAGPLAGDTWVRYGLGLGLRLG